MNSSAKDFGGLYHRHCGHSIFCHTHVSMRKFASQQMKIKNAACT